MLTRLSADAHLVMDVISPSLWLDDLRRSRNENRGEGRRVLTISEADSLAEKDEA
jgi:hypothetical protein